MEAAKAFYSSNLELYATGISWENFKAKFLYRFRDVRSDQYHFMQLLTSKQRKEETLQEFWTVVIHLLWKTAPKVEDPLIQKFRYDQAQRMFL